MIVNHTLFMRSSLSLVVVPPSPPCSFSSFTCTVSLSSSTSLFSISHFFSIPPLLRLPRILSWTSLLPPLHVLPPLISPSSSFPLPPPTLMESNSSGHREGVQIACPVNEPLMGVCVCVRVCVCFVVGGWQRACGPTQEYLH